MLKRLFSLFLGTLALLTVTLPAWAGGIGTLRSNSANARINVRSQPTINSSSPHYGVPGDRVEIVQCVQDRDRPNSDLNWCKVRFLQSNAEGWVRSDFIIFPSDGRL